MITTIPVLPCISLDETLAFYAALGFEVTWRQTRPYVYAATRRGDIHLHFMGMPKLDPAGAYSTCLVVMPEIEDLHRTLADGLRQAYGRLPLSGIPRISRLRKGQGRFTVVDVAGNSIVLIRRPSEPASDEAVTGSRTEQSLRTAARLRDEKNDDAAAAAVLDAALRRSDPTASVFERAQVIAARMELAVVAGDAVREGELRAALDDLALTDAERAEIAAELPG